MNVAYFLWVERHGNSTDGGTLLRFGAVEPFHVRAGEYWRIASYMILHIGWGHLLLNTWAGVSWCTVVERALGGWRFLLVYVLAGIGGGAACAAFSHAVTAGASGAMFGIIGALLAIRYRTLGSFEAFTKDRGVRATVGQIAIWTVLGIVAIPMSQSAHFGGFITGGLATLAQLRLRRAPAWAAFSVALLALCVAATRPWELMQTRAAMTNVDFPAVKVGRMGRPKEQPEVVEAAAKRACERGVERACVIHYIGSLDPADRPRCARAYTTFEAACSHGDADGCAGQGFLLGLGCGIPQDLDKGMELLERGCDLGSEYGCELKL